MTEHADADRVEAAVEHFGANRSNWDERTAVHFASDFYDVEAWLREKTGPRKREVDALGDVRDKSLVHLHCHFGMDTLSWARAGAVVTGIDFSETAIEAARHLARRAGLEEVARFVCANVYDAAEALNGETFDIVYVSLGAICWIPDIDGWGAQVAALLSPGGRFYMHEQHPLAWALADDDVRIEHSYFEEAEPFVDDSGDTYTDPGNEVLINTRTYEWNHGIGELVTSLLDRGLQLDSLVEHDWTVWARWPWLTSNGEGGWTTPPGAPRMPLTFTLTASRPPRDTPQASK